MTKTLVEGWYTVKPIDKERYQERDGLEGPFQTRAGKVVYYDPREGSYYDPDTDMYLSYDEWRELNEGCTYSVEYTTHSGKSVPVAHRTFEIFSEAVAFGKAGIAGGNYKSFEIFEEAAQIDEISPESAKMEEADSVQDLASQAIQSKLKKAKVSYRDPNAKTARDEDRIAKMLAAKAKKKNESVELDEANAENKSKKRTYLGKLGADLNNAKTSKKLYPGSSAAIKLGRKVANETASFKLKVTNPATGNSETQEFNSARDLRDYAARAKQRGLKVSRIKSTDEGAMTSKQPRGEKPWKPSMSRPNGEWDPIHGKAPRKGTLKYDIWKSKVRQDKGLDEYNEGVETRLVNENLHPGRDFDLASKAYKGYVLGGVDDSDEDRRATLWGIYQDLGNGTYKQVGSVLDPKTNGKHTVSAYRPGVPFEEFKWTVDNQLSPSNAVNEDISQDAHHMERDHEVQMARSDLYKTANYAIKLHSLLKNVSEAEGIDGWMQAKITKAADYISSVYHALEYDMIEQNAPAPMSAMESVNETTTAGGVAAVVMPLGKIQKRKKTNEDSNALATDSNGNPITMQDVRLYAGEGTLSKKTIAQAVAIIKKHRASRTLRYKK